MHSRRNKKILSIILVIFVLIVTLATSIGETSAYSETNKSEFENILETQNEQTEEMQWNEDAEEITEDSDKSVNIIYDPQPATKEEVQTAITIYEKEYKAVLELLGFAAALKVLKPHWEFAVEAELMPDGYNCQLVDWDEDFEAVYYTFFPSPVKMVNSYSMTYMATPPAASGINISSLFSFIGYAGIDGGTNRQNIAVIVNDSLQRYGAMWANEQLDLTQYFETSMSLYLHHKSSSITGELGDGMTFTMHNDPRGKLALGSDGEGLGVYGSTHYLEYDKNSSDKNPVSVIGNALAIEFDLYENDYIANGTLDHYMDDPKYGSSYGHCALLYPPYPLSEVRILATDHKYATPFLKQGKWYSFNVKWKPEISTSGIVGGTLIYTFDGGTPQSEKIENVRTVFGDTKVYWGFTGSTGTNYSVLAAALTAYPTPQTVITVTKEVEDSEGNEIDNKYAAEGDILRYFVTVKADKANIGPITITDELSPYVEYAGGDVTVTTSTNASFTVSPVFNGSVMTVNTGRTLAAVGDWLKISFDVKVKDGTGGNIVYNTANANATSLMYPVASNTTKVTILGYSRKYVADNSKAGTKGAAVTVGDEITYEILYINSTGSKANLTITDDLDEGVKYVSHSNDGVNSRNGNKVVWQISDVEAGADGRVTVTVEVTKDIDRDKELVNKAVLLWSTSPTPEEPSTQNPVAGYNVIYNGNGGVDLEDEPSHEYGLHPIEENHIVHENSGEGGEGFVQNGCTFAEWNTKKDGSGKAYKPGSIITGITEDIVLYAQWIKHTEFEFKKEDKDTAAELEGAVFTLYKYDPDADTPPAADTVVTDSTVTAGTWALKETAISDTDGLVTFSNLTAGYYQLVEDIAPEGYEKATVQWRLFIEADGALYKVISVTTVKKAPEYSAGFDFEKKSGISDDFVYVLPNEKKAEFTFTKVQEDEKTALRGAQFKLYSWEGTGEMPDIVEDSLILDGRWKLVDTQESGDDGKVSFESLDKKDYQLVETKAPPGYSRPMGQWRLTAYSSGKWTILGKGSVLPPAFADVSGKYILTNMKGKFFPLTGFGGILNYLVAGLGIMAAAAAGIVFLLFSQKRKIKNK